MEEAMLQNRAKLAALLAAEVRSNPDLIPIYLEAIALGAIKKADDVQFTGMGNHQTQVRSLYTTAQVLRDLGKRINGD